MLSQKLETILKDYAKLWIAQSSTTVVKNFRKQKLQLLQKKWLKHFVDYVMLMYWFIKLLIYKLF